ncbi:reverse transcriptase domain-containing protein [Aliarcobacter butzleri]|uniref:reverse transcriptase domain-containing protein n=1 Tax=Aliarcobacter butzleri TaxID=28197 RepID=UPI003AF3F533
MSELANKLFECFVINQRYFAIQKNGYYHAKNQYVNSKTIENILNNKNSFLCYQEDYNLIKWICFDFDVNKELIDNGEFDKNKSDFYQELNISIQKLLDFLNKKDINYLIEFSGNRGIHIWILFENNITRQDGYIIFQSILDKADIQLNTKFFSLDKYPKSLYSSTNTDKGTGVKIPLSFHQKSKKYSCIIENLNDFDLTKLEITNIDSDFAKNQLAILNKYIKQKKDELFDKLEITEEKIVEEYQKHNFVNSVSISSNNKDLNEIIDKLSHCKHLKNIFNKNRPNEKEARIVVGLLGQLQNDNQNIGKNLLFSFFREKERASESIIKQRLAHSNRCTPPTCSYFRDLFNENCNCESIKETPMEFLDGYSPIIKEIFELNEDLFDDIKKAQIKYSKQNDEIIPFHTLNNLNRYDYQLIRHDINDFKKLSFVFQPHYEYTREENTKERKLYSISARDKIITTFAIKILDSVFYKDFSSHSFGYRFNPSFRQSDIFEHWLKQWNMYIKELKTLIYSEDFKEYYILKLDLKSFYDSVNLQKLQIELNQNIDQSYQSGIIQEEDKQTYFEIINNLINFSKQILKNDTKGLPQGPAYARYLAEFYLISLDGIIEQEIKNKGFYYRFVDDMFVILPTKKDMDLLENKLIEHLATKDLSISDNSEKIYKGMINSFKPLFENYVDNTKYFIDSVSKNKDINTQTTIHQASSKLLELIKNDEGEINDKNLTFLYTHLDDSKQIIEKKQELESYIINQAKGRGSFFNIFWRYYFAKYNFSDINFSIFKNIRRLKRESFLNSLLIILNSDNSLSNSSLKSLLDLYLTTDLSSIEKLSILEIYSINNDLFNEGIIVKIGNDINIYNDFILSAFSKNIPLQILQAIEKNILELPNNNRFDYLYNLFFYSENNTVEVIQKFSDIFVNSVNTILNSVIESKIPYLENHTNLLKYIQIVYLSTLFSSSENKENFESKIYPIWKNLLWYIKHNSNLQKNIISKFKYWKNKIEDISLEKSNIHFLMPIIKEANCRLTNGFDDELKLVDNYFNFLIELIYLSNKEGIELLADLQDIKNYLVTDKKVKYLEWLDGVSDVYYPSKEICIKNSIFNDITILKKENQILVRLRSELDFQKEIDYLTVEYEEKERIFEGKYKTIIYSFDAKDYEQINQRVINNIYEFINHIFEIKTKLDDFCKKYHYENCYINFFYQKFFINKNSGYPLIPFDGFSKYFLRDNDKYLPRSHENYIRYVLDLINQTNLKLIQNDQSKIFDNFAESFFPKSINDIYHKLDFINQFNELSKFNKPQTLFELEELLIQTCYEYLADKKDNIFDMLSIYLSFNRADKEYLLFDSNIDIKDDNFESFLNTIQYSIYHNRILAKLFGSKIESIKSLEVINDFVGYKKAFLDYEVNQEEYEVTLNGEVINMEKLEYLDVTNDELNFFPVTEDKLASLKNSTLFVRNDEKCQIIIAPLVLVKTYSIIKNRKRAIEKNDTPYLFKPYRSLDELRHFEYFDEAVTVLDHHYRYSELFDKKEKRENHLEQWLRCFNDEDDIKALLCIIGKHQYFSEEDVKSFVDGINSYKDSNEYLITNIKTSDDNNGTHRLINLQSDKNLWRELDLKAFPQKLLDTDKKKIVFLADNIISGSQTKKAFANYYLKETYSEAEIKKSSYHEIGSDNFEDFKSKLLSVDEIIFHSIFYTEKAVEVIKKYFEQFGCQEKIKFSGKKKKFDDCIFDKLIERNEKNIFKYISQNEKFLAKNFEIPCIKRTEVKDTDEEFVKRNIVVRYNSMPTKRFFIFTHKPKYYQYPLFQYKSDFRDTK